MARDQIVAGGRYDVTWVNGKRSRRRWFCCIYGSDSLIANGQLLKENNDYSYEVIIYDPEFRKSCFIPY